MGSSKIKSEKILDAIMQICGDGKSRDDVAAEAFELYGEIMIQNQRGAQAFILVKIPNEKARVYAE
jgi:hypothetical protein